MDPRFYVYAYLREDCQTPYYVGKGTGNRAWSKKRNFYPPKDKTRIKIIASSLYEDEAFLLEKKLINYFGRKDLGTGILHNQTDGGEGGSNISLEVRAKRSKALKGVYVGERSVWGGKKNPAQSERMKGENHPLYGVPCSEERKHKSSEKQKSIIRPKIECPHCKVWRDSGNYAKAHGDKCKDKNNE
jgi:hypothetical protein